jgi:aspartyl protease family protein
VDDDDKPWGANARRPSTGPSTARRRVLVWLALLAAVALVLFYVSREFPGHPHGGMDTAWAIRLFAVLAFVSSGLIFARRIDLGEVARNIALWTAIAAVLAVGYTFRRPLHEALLQVESEFIPGQPVVTGPHEMILTANPSGGFFVYGTVNRVRVRFAIDTGASDIVLSPADAGRAGIAVAALSFDKHFETANGIGRGADATIDTLTIGPIKRFNVPVSVNEAPMRTSLLGMAFLRSLKSFKVSRDRLVLRW